MDRVTNIGHQPGVVSRSSPAAVVSAMTPDTIGQGSGDGADHVTTLAAGSTAREQTEAFLDERKAALRSFLATVPGSVYKINADWSELRLFDDTQDANCTRLESYVPAEEHPAVLAAIREAIARRRPLELEHRVVRLDGTTGWTFSHAIPVRNAQGEVREWICLASDVTERRRAEEALRVALQAAEQARAAAEAAAKAKDHLLAVLSHELRTPLVPVLLATHTLSRRGDLPAEIAEIVGMIRRNVELQAHFIDDLLDVARITHGKLELARTSMDVHEAIQRAVEVVMPDIEVKQQQLTIGLGATECRLHGDSRRLQQVFWNLLKNASKFTPPHGALEVRSRAEPEGVGVVEVADSGIGLELEDAERIFRPFEQASATVTRTYGGLGLGLAIAQAVVEAHGGTLRASSPGPGLGATFTVRLPLTAS